MKYLFKKPWKRFLFKLIDTIGWILFFWARFLPRSNSVRRILLMRMDQIGDVVFTIPAVRAIKRKYPDASIDYLVGPWSEELVELLPEIGKIISFPDNWFSPSFSLKKCAANFFGALRELKRGKYDLAIDFRGDFRNIFLLFLAGIPERLSYGVTGGGFLLSQECSHDKRIHQVDLNLKLVQKLCCDIEDKSFGIQLSDSRKEAGRDLLVNIPKMERKVVVHMGAGYPSKQWGSERYRRLIDMISEKKLAWVVLVGLESERSLVGNWSSVNGRVLNLIGKTTFSELAAVIDQCDLFIGNDSGPSHIAAALGKKEVVIFSGTNDADIWKPWNPKAVLIRKDVPCSPCEEKVCFQPRHYCMEDIAVEEVFRKVQGLLTQRVELAC